MHELSIAIELLRLCEAELRARGGGTLERVRIAVGELSSVEPELLRLAWEGVAQCGPHDGATLEIDWRRARQLCESCGEVGERQPGTWLRLCPDCGSVLQVQGGDELDLLELETARSTSLCPRALS